MDLDRIEKIVRDRIKALYFARFPEKGVTVEIEGFEGTMLRLRKMQRSIGEHRQFMLARAKQRDTIESYVALLRDLRRAIDAGKRLISIDVERNYDQILQEIGYTTYQNGVMESFNLRIEGAPKRRTSFAFGDSEVLEWETIKPRMIAEAEAAYCFIGHSFTGDLEQMKANGLRLPHRPIVDTFWLSYLVEAFGGKGQREGANLSEMAAYFGVDASRPHSGGNDARYNMEVVLAMVEAYGTYE